MNTTLTHQPLARINATRELIKREIIYRHRTLLGFADAYDLNYRLVIDFFRGANNNRNVTTALLKEGFIVPAIRRREGA